MCFIQSCYAEHISVMLVEGRVERLLLCPNESNETICMCVQRPSLHLELYLG